MRDDPTWLVDAHPEASILADQSIESLFCVNN
jgi:hypothetical protein